MSNLELNLPIVKFLAPVAGSKNYAPRLAKWVMIHTTDTTVPITPQWLLNFFYKSLKWSKPGYAFWIDKQGTIYQFIELPRLGWLGYEHITWGEPKVNAEAVHICYEGGAVIENGKRVYKDTRTPEQKSSMEKLVKALLEAYPHTKVLGHNQMSNKACPCFFVPRWAKSVGIPSSRIYENDPFGYSKIFK